MKATFSSGTPVHELGGVAQVMLLEREHELQQLDRALHAAQHSHGQIVLIEAPAGLGKSALLVSAYDSAQRQGFTCSRARASELEHDFPYGVMRRLLEPVIGELAAANRSQLFVEAAGLAMPLFVPGAAVPAPDSAFAVLHGLYWLLNNLTRDHPVVLCIDDLHWADLESMRFLGYLAARLDGLALAVLGTVRARQHVTLDLDRLLAAPEVQVLQPAPLSIRAAAALCEQRLGATVEPEFAAACHSATGGNPFFLQTLLREARELRFLTDASEVARVRRIGPAAVARAVLLRLASAAPAATSLVRAVAVLGDGTSVVDAARLAELPEAAAAQTADMLAELAILARAERLEFAHPLVRQAIYESIGAHERAHAHARAARVLTQRGAAQESIAAHIAKAEPIGDAERVELLHRVGLRALAQGAPAAAVAWLMRALSESPAPDMRPTVLLDLGIAELRLGMSEALEHLREAVATLSRPLEIANGARQLANALSMAGQAHSAVTALEAAIHVVAPQDRELALVLEAELAAKAQQADRPVRMAAAARLARLGELKGVTVGERLVLATQAFERARGSESEAETVRHLEQGFAGGALFGQQPDVVGPFYALVIALLATDALDLGHQTLEHALAEAHTRSSIPALAFITVHRGWFSLRAGAVAQAEADARTALDLMAAHDIRLGRQFALALLIETLLETGQTDAAAQALAASSVGRVVPPGLANTRLLEARGLLHLARGNAQAAYEDLLEYGRREEQWGAAHPLSSRWRTHACLALGALGEAADAQRMAAEDLERARRWGAASSIGVAMRTLALVEAGTTTLEQLTAAAAVLEHSITRLEYARTLVELGAAQRRANRRAEARSTLQQGLELAGECGASVLAERASVELRAAGGPSSDPRGSPVQQLTVSERRVAELAARGRSNPQIAQTLFVTRKTVETHLGHIYSKLGISGRTELARALGIASP